MAGIEDLGEMLQNLSVSRRPGTWTLVSVGPAAQGVLDEPITLSDEVAALISETEGTTAVVTVEEAARRGWPAEFRGAWLTLDIHSSLEGVGLTAAVSTALAERGIAANMIAGFFHDHLLVPEDRAGEAITAIEALADGG